MRKIAFFSFFLLVGGIVLGAEPNSWHGFTLDVATIDDVKNELGAAANEKTKQKFRSSWKERLDKNARYHTLEYKNKFGMDKVCFWFQLDSDSGNEILRVIQLILKEEINPNALPEVYGTPFDTSVSALTPGRTVLSEGNTVPARLPTIYNLLAMTDDSYIEANVSRGSGFGQIMGTLGGVSDNRTSWPGKVYQLYLISRGTEDRSGLDVLE